MSRPTLGAPPSRLASPNAITVPKATTTQANGWVRRHSSTGASPTATIVANGRQATSSRRTPSSSAVTITTPTSTQSRDTRSGASVARGSAHSELRALVVTQPV
ncbi:hypothetical protein PV371_16680 [Streptomyces sp. TX20-6-3]|uniref:hypothetical protein n=1 Tax=Streptomyces sp. TX20-6-3 TaxID=3028705 RepID=UPI0029AA2EE4|nr:hypothetical protein [Streptomyces sp. TX20-6-3]MDX2561283.1 hypothetical protein [Streptomyces sp. TX20-6-3]